MSSDAYFQGFALFQVAAGRSLQQATQATVHGDHVHFGELNTLKNRLDYDHTVDPLGELLRDRPRSLPRPLAEGSSANV